MIDLPWYVFALSGAFFVALSGVLEKHTLKHEEPLHFSGATALMGGIFSLPVLFFVDWSSITPHTYVWLYAISLTSVAAFWIVATVVKKLDAGEVSTILALTPAVTALLAYGFLGEVLNPQQIGGILIIVLGLVALEAPYLKTLLSKVVGQRAHLITVALALLAVLLYALGSLLDRFVLTNFSLNAIEFIAITQVMLVGTFLMLELIFRKKGNSMFSTLKRSPLKVAGVAALLFVSRMLHAQAISMVFVALASALKRVGAIFTILLAGSLLKEKDGLRKLLAASLILAGVMGLTL